jgi:hypothetical protein
MLANPPRGDDLVLGPIVAYKAAQMVTSEDGTIAFRGVGYGGVYGAHDMASCVSRASHVPPHPGCACGFYAWRERDSTLVMIDDGAFVLLEVALWGAFHEYDLGYVAAAQSVRSITVQPYCVVCRMRRRELRTATALNMGARPFAILAPVCNEHVQKQDRVVSLGWIEQTLQVETAWASPDDPLTAAAASLIDGLPLPPPRVFRRVDDLLPFETGHVFQNALAEGADGTLYIDVLARLVQPLIGTDVPLQLGEDGVHEVLLDGLRDFSGWAPRRDLHKFALPVRQIGNPAIRCVEASAADPWT